MMRIPRILLPVRTSFKVPSRDVNSEKRGVEDNVKHESKSDNSESKQSTVSVALIGGGLTPAYTSMLLKQESIIKCVNVADTGNKAEGLILDASHIDTSTKIKYFEKNRLAEALRDVEIIALMNENDFSAGKSSSKTQFLASSRYVKNIAETMVQSCPTAIVAVFTNPVTATLPLVSEIYKCAGLWDPDRIIGSLAIDSMRIEAMAADLLDLNPAFTSIPVVGGADSCTIVPLLSQAKPVDQFSMTEQESLLRTLRASDNELASLEKCGGTGPKLSMATAASKLILKLACGYCGFKNSIASAYVRSNVLPTCRFFATELQFGRGGVLNNFGLPKVSNNELELIEQAIPIINANIDLAMNFVKDKSSISRNKM